MATQLKAVSKSGIRVVVKDWHKLCKENKDIAMAIIFNDTILNLKDKAKKLSKRGVS